MADYGNYFTSNSGNYNYNTRGHSYDDSDWVIVGLANSGNVSQPIPYPNGAEFTGNNTTCYFYTTNHMSKPNREVKTGNDYVAYFNWATANKNTIGSVDGDFNFYPFGSKTDSRFVEPTGLDDTKHGVSPYSNSNNNVISRTNLTVKGTTFTAGYRRHKIQYEPSIRYDLDSYNYGTNDNYKSDGSTKATGGRVVTQRYDAFQTFYNIEDPYSVLNISIANHDDAKSSSPTFCTLTNNRSEYRISHSYTYNPYTNSATWNNTNYLSFTYNTLPTYPKELVFTYGSNYNSVSYDGDTITVEAKARYNGTYDRFTTSTANDDGFSSYKRYVDVTYSLSTFNSSTTPTGSNTYTFRIWQPGSKLGISYNWSIDSNPSWVHLSTTSGNTTNVTFDDQGDVKPSVGGTLSLSLNNTTISNGGSTSGSVSGISWTAPINKSARSCVLRQNMTVTNYCAQNITPKNVTTGMPEKTMVITQSAMTWNNPEVDMNWRVTYYSSDTSTYNDDYAFCYPTVTIGQVSSTNNDIKTNRWKYSTTSYNISVVMPKFNRPWVHTQTNGKVYITKEEGIIGYKGGSKKIYFSPEISFINGYTSGVSERVWKLSNISNNNVQEQTGSVKTFDDILLKMPSIPAQNHAFGSAVLTWKNSGETGYRDDFTFDYKSKSWNNKNDKDSITTSVGGNLPNIGKWRAIADNGELTFTSTTRDAPARTGKILFECSTYQDGTVTPSPSSLLFQQYGTNISGTITINGEGSGLVTYDSSVDYPMNFAIFTTKYSLKPKEYIHVTKVENLAATITSPTNRNVIWQGETIYFGKKSGTVTTETTASKTYPYKITVSSNIVSTYPSNVSDGVILNGKVTPYDADYVIEYSVDSGSWTTSTTATIGQRPAVWSSSPSLVVRSSGWTNVNEGIYKYTRGWYASQGSTTHTVAIRVRDKNNGNKVFSGTSTSITQNGQDGYPTDTQYTFATTGTNCTTSTPSATGSSAGNYGSFSVSPWSPISDPSGNQGSENNISNYIYNYSNKLSEGYWDSSTISVTFIGSNKTFGYNESVSMEFGVSSSSPDTKVWIYTGKKTWNYKYKFGIKASNESNYHYSTLTGTGSIGPYSSITYYRKISFDGGSTWTRLSGNGKSTITLTSTGTYTVKVGWWSGSDGPYHTKSNTITIGKISRIYRLLVSISGNSNKDAFDTTNWTLTATVTAQYQEGGGSWTNTTTPSGISYSWSGASGSGSTATVGVSSVSMGSDGDHLGTKNVTVTVSLSGYTGDSATVTLGRYGKSYYNG
jgi:hypothetical protein